MNSSDATPKQKPFNKTEFQIDCAASSHSVRPGKQFKAVFKLTSRVEALRLGHESPRVPRLLDNMPRLKVSVDTGGHLAEDSLGRLQGQGVGATDQEGLQGGDMKLLLPSFPGTSCPAQTCERREEICGSLGSRLWASSR